MIHIDVVDDPDDLANSVNGPGNGGLLAMSILAVGFLVLFVVLFGRRAAGDRSDRIFTSFLVILLIALSSSTISLPILLSENAEGQIVPEVEWTMGSAPPIDLSPLSPDGSSIIEVEMSYSDGEPAEHILRIAIDGPGYIFAYVKEQRVPANGSITFTVAVAHRSSHVYAGSSGTVFCEVIEHQGVPGNTGPDFQAGFIIRSAYYSLPFINLDRPIIHASNGREQTTDILVTNYGRMNDGFLLGVEGNDSLESLGFGFSLPIDRIHLDLNGSAVQPVTVSIPADMPSDHQVIRFSSEGYNEGDNCAIAGATLVVLEDPGEDGIAGLWEDHGFPLAIPPLLLCLIVVLIIRWKRSSSSTSPSTSSSLIRP